MWQGSKLQSRTRGPRRRHRSPTGRRGTFLRHHSRPSRDPTRVRGRRAQSDEGWGRPWDVARPSRRRVGRQTRLPTAFLTYGNYRSTGDSPIFSAGGILIAIGAAGFWAGLKMRRAE
jgi:hypothetical protein